MRSRPFLVIVILIGCLGAGLRLAHLSAIRATPFYHFDEAWTSSDMHANRAWAQAIAGGDWLDRNGFRPHFSWQDNVADEATWRRWLGPATYYQPPLYTYLVALSIRGSGGPDAWRFLQTLLGAVNVILIGLLGRRLAGPLGGILAALLVAGYAPFILYDSELLRGTLVITLNTLALLALLVAGEGTAPDKNGGSPLRANRWWILAGIFLGISYLCDSSIVTFVPLAFLWAVLHRSGPDEPDERSAPKRESRGAPRARWKAGLPRAAWLGVGFVASLLPLFARNVAVGAPLFSSTTRGPLAFVMGNAPDARPVGAAVPDSTAEILAASDYRIGATILETIRRYQGDLGSLISRQWEKLSGLFNAYEVPDNPSFYYAALRSPVLRWGLRFSCLSGLGLVGMLLGARRWRGFSLLYLYVAGVLSLFLLAHVVSRYRQPLVIPLALFTAVALVEAGEALRGKRFRAAAAILIGGVALSFALPSTPPKGYRYYRPAEFIIASERLESEGDIKHAGAEFREAIALALKENALEKERIDLGLAMGDLFLRHQHYPEALSAFRDVLEDEPMNEEALVATGGIHHDTNQPIEALSMLLRAESVDPNNAEVEARLGHLFWVTFHDGAKALPRLRKALELAPNSSAAANLSALAAEAAAATGLTP